MAHRAERGAGRHWLRGTAQAIAAVLSMAIVVGTGWAWLEYRSFNNGVNVGAAVVRPSGDPEPSGAAYARADQNILLLGNDSRDGATPQELIDLGTSEDGGSANTDTMMILHVPADGSQATAVSFPRDSYVDIPGYYRDKLNAAYPDGYQTAAQQGLGETARQSAGIAVLIATLNQLTGVSIDHYVQVNLLGFYRISQALQGVTVCLNEAAKEPNSGIDLPKGTSVIEGKQALAFVRQRYGYPDGQGDLDRIRRQQYFLSAVFRQTLSAGTLLNPGKLNSLLSAVSSSLLIDPDLNLLGLAAQVSDLQAGNLNFYTIPTTGFENVDVGAVVGVDPDAVKAFVESKFNPVAASATPTAPTSATGSPTGSLTGAPTASPTPSSSPTEGVVPSSASPVNAAAAGCID